MYMWRSGESLRAGFVQAASRKSVSYLVEAQEPGLMILIAAVMVNEYMRVGERAVGDQSSPATATAISATENSCDRSCGN